jgi:hypothetical protein
MTLESSHKIAARLSPVVEERERILQNRVDSTIDHDYENNEYNYNDDDDDYDYDDDDDSGRPPPPPPSYPHPDDILSNKFQDGQFNILETWTLREEDEDDLSDLESEHDDHNNHVSNSNSNSNCNSNCNSSSNNNNNQNNNHSVNKSRKDQSLLATTSSSLLQRYKRCWIVFFLVLVMAVILILGIGFGTNLFGTSMSSSLAYNPSETTPFSSSPMNMTTTSPSISPTTSTSTSTSTPTPTSMPTTKSSHREDILKEFLSSVSSRGIAAFTNSDSGEYNALQWLVHEDPLQLHPKQDAERLLQRYALVSFYYASNDWKDETNWLDVTNECTWYGVVCDTNSKKSSETSPSMVVVALEFSNNGYGGTIPPDLTLLNHLTSLQLANNPITGTIESIPWERWKTTLTLLNLAQNEWTGSLGTRIFQLWNLRELDLSDNLALTGSLPSLSIETLSNLESWKMKSTGMGGSLPTTIGRLIQLKTLELDHSKFSNQIPTELARLTNLGT